MLAATKQWYPAGQSPPMSEYYEKLAIGQSDLDESVPTLNQLARDKQAPAIVRATALAVLTDDPAEESLATALAALADPDPKVASAAISRIDTEIRRVIDRNRYGNISGDDRKQLKALIGGIASLLAADSRRLRIESARSLVGIPAEYRQSYLAPNLGQAFDLALDDYKRSLYVENDRAGYHMMLGSLHEILGDRERAKEDYRAAITVEPNLAGPRSNLAAILESEYEGLQNQLQQTQAGGGMAAGQLKGIVAQMQNLNQQSSRLRGQDHGLLAKEIQRSEGLAGSHGLHYRFAMSSYIQRDLAATEKHLLEAIGQQPDNSMYLMGLATYYLHVKAPEKASGYIDQLIQQDPNHAGYQALRDQAQQQLQIKRQDPDGDADPN
jgi:tetratricopeptide (TPR) repeat protein